MRRRQLWQALGGLGIGTWATRWGGAIAAAETLPVLRPPRLRSGDRVGIVSPAGATYSATDLAIVTDAVAALDLVPVVGDHVLATYGYLAGTDVQRAADLNRFFADPTIAAVLPIRGDWGSARVLPYLDYDTIRQNPKILIGFSDITALLLGIHAQTGLVTFHGPHGLTGWQADQVDVLRQVLFDGEPLTYTNPLVGGDQSRLMRVQGRLHTITPGRVRGPLFGGNLSVLSGIAGSPYLPDLTDAILFVEDIGEAPYRVDRMLTQLKLAGLLDQLRGFVFGQCTNCGPGPFYGSLTLEQILEDHLAPLGIPAVAGLWIGHVDPLWTLPLGLPTTLDTAAGSLTVEQSPVV